MSSGRPLEQVHSQQLVAKVAQEGEAPGANTKAETDAKAQRNSKINKLYYISFWD